MKKTSCQLARSTKSTRLTLAQNRIDYIVYGNPKGATRLIEQHGYEPLDKPQDLVKAIKKLVQRNGLKTIKELIKIHPDRQAILKVQRGKEDNYCGACSSYSYNPQDNYCGVCGHAQYQGKGDRVSFLNQLIDLSVDELEKYYENTLRKAEGNQDDSNLAQEVEMVWNELRLRKVKDKVEHKASRELEVVKDGKEEEVFENPQQAIRKEVLMLGLVFVAGVLVGSSLSGGLVYPGKSVVG